MDVGPVNYSFMDLISSLFKLHCESLKIFWTSSMAVLY